MKKLISTLLVLTLILTVGATAALAEETAPGASSAVSSSTWTWNR